MELFVGLLTGVLYTLRGGGISHIVPCAGTQFARLSWCLPVGLSLGVVANLPPLCLVLPVLALFVGLLIPHGWCQNQSLVDYLGMTAVGLARGLIVSVVLYFFSPFVALCTLIAYSTHGVGYAIGWNMPYRDVWWSWSEVWCGFLLGLTFTLLLGL